MTSAPQEANSESAAAVPKYVAIYNTLRGRIIGGEFAQSGRLPSENALMRQFGASRVTVRLALGILRAAGLVESRQGRGHFVRPFRAIQDLGRLQGFGEMMASAGIEAHSIVLETSERPASQEVRRALKLADGDDVVAIERVRVGGNVPLSYDISYFPKEIGARLVKLDLARADVFKLLETELGIELGFADLVLELAVADRTIAGHLRVREGDALTRIRRLTHDRRGRPIDFEYLYGRPDAFQFQVRVPRR